MYFTTRCALNFEGVEIWLFGRVERLEIGDPVHFLAIISLEKLISLPLEIRCQCQCKHCGVIDVLNAST